MTEAVTVYTYRDRHFAPSGNTIISVAPLTAVVAAFGGGGLKESHGVGSLFGGSAYFRDEETGEQYLGIWGARNAARFRSTLRKAGFTLQIMREHPPARLLWYSTDSKPSKRARRHKKAVKAVQSIKWPISDS